MIPEEINIICVGDIRYRFKGEIIQHWDFDYNDHILRIDFKDDSFIEFYKQNIICVEVNKTISEKGAGMTREEAIEVLKKNGEYDRYYIGEVKDKSQEAIGMAIKALEQEPCEDCISRKSLKYKLQEHHDFFVNAYGGFSNLPQNDKSRVDEITNCIAMVVNEPSVTPKPKTDVLDKIKAEIESHIIDSNGLDFNSALCIAIEIINNYRAEGNPF